MKFISIALCILLLKITPLSAQSKEVKYLIDTTIDIMIKNAVNRKMVNWDSLRTNTYTLAKDITDPYKLGPAIRYLYSAVNDFHGAFFYKDSTFQWHRNHDKVPDSIMNEWKKGVKSITKVLNGNIGYLRIPSILIKDDNDFNTKAQSLNDSLCTLLQKNVKGIILDLRLNGGGAMHPMILGLEQLLTDGKLGSFKTNKIENWILKENGFYVDSSLISKITPSCNYNVQQIPIVMLVGKYTASSGECLIIAFKGRKKTILLGTETAGYVTVNNGFKINDSAFMNLAIGYNADRNSNVYKKSIKPDIFLKSIDKFNDLENDEKVKAALKWLHNNFKSKSHRKQ